MAFIPAPNIVQVEMRCLLDSQKVENRWNINALGPVTPTVVDNITNVVQNWAINNYLPFLTTYLTVNSFVGTDLTTDDGSQHTIVPEGPPTGALNEVPLPNEVSFAVQLKTAARGRSARGRTYVMGVPHTKVVQNTVDVVWANNLVAAFNQLRTNITTEGWDLVIVSYRHDKVIRPGGPVFYSVTNAAYADLIVDSQRRRKPGVGQ